jgi:hypothetical protein
MLEILSSITVIWAVSIIGIVGTIIALENQAKGIASGIVSLVLALLLWNYGPEIWVFIKANVDLTIYFSLGYVILGVVWSFIKWNEKVKNVFRTFKNIKDKFIAKHGEITEGKQREKFNSKLDYKFKNADNDLINFYGSDTFETIILKINPVGLENKGLITSWIMYWPLSLLGTLLNNPFRRFFAYVYESVSGLYDKISDKHKKNALDNL